MYLWVWQKAKAAGSWTSQEHISLQRLRWTFLPWVPHQISFPTSWSKKQIWYLQKLPSFVFCSKVQLPWLTNQSVHWLSAWQASQQAPAQDPARTRPKSLEVTPHLSLQNQLIKWHLPPFTTLPTLPTIVLHSWIFRLALFHPAAGKNHYQTSSNNKTQPSGSVAKPCEHNTLEDLTHHLCFFTMSSCSRQTFTCNRSLEHYATVSNVNPKKSKCWRKKFTAMVLLFHQFGPILVQSIYSK